MNSKTFIEAEVSSVEYPKKGQPYAVTRLTGKLPEGSKLTLDSKVTFSLSEWEGDQAPVRDQVVLLDDIQKFTKGWRARKASPLRA